MRHEDSTTSVQLIGVLGHEDGMISVQQRGQWGMKTAHQYSREDGGA